MNHNQNPVPLIYIIAGEASGDLIGASLMSALKQLNPGIKFAGIGGTGMIESGLASLFAMQELSVMGIFEIIPKIFKILKRIRQTRQHIMALKPSVVITIDAPGFNFRVVKNLKNLGIPLIHYVAPSVWAWRPWRARKVAKLYNCLLTLFAFEPKYFIPHGLATYFVGHPLIEKHISSIATNQFRRENCLDKNSSLICLLPGSRQREIKTLMPIFIETIEKLKTHFSDLKIVVPTLIHLREQIKQYTDKAGIDAYYITNEKAKYAAMRSASVTLAASGTVTLELALAQTPMVVAYKINKLTYIILKLLVKSKYAALPNILLNQSIVTECLQENCNSQTLAIEIIKLLSDNNLKKNQIKELSEIHQLLQANNQSPSVNAAHIILKYCDSKNNY